MGNCEPCTRANPVDAPVMTKQDLISKFEEALPFKKLYIDEFEQVMMAAARVQKINQQYEPPLWAHNCKLRRIVKYFKSVDNDWKELGNPHSKLYNMLKSTFLSA